MYSTFPRSGFPGAFAVKDLSEGFAEEKLSGKKSSQFTAMLNSGQEATKDEKAESGLCSTQRAGGLPRGKRGRVRRE